MLAFDRLDKLPVEPCCKDGVLLVDPNLCLRVRWYHSQVGPNEMPPGA